MTKEQHEDQGQTGEQPDEWMQKVIRPKGKDGALRVKFKSKDGEPFSQRDLNLLQRAIRVEYKKYRADRLIRHRKQETTNGR